MSGHRMRYDEEVSDLLQPGPDPGTGKAIPAAKGVISLVIGGGAETNTLPDPPRPGILLTINVYSKGAGSRAITAATKINQAANTVMTFDNVDDSIQLYSVPFATNKARWQVVANDNVALS